MYSLYLCVHCFVCIGIYIFMRMFIFCAVVTLSRGALLFLATLCSLCSTFFLIKPLFMLFCRTFARYLLPFLSVMRFLPYLCSRFAFCRSFAPNACNVHFMRFLSGFKRVNCVARTFHRLPYFVRLYSLICGKFAVLEGVGVGLPPKPKRREAQLR